MHKFHENKVETTRFPLDFSCIRMCTDVFVTTVIFISQFLIDKLTYNYQKMNRVVFWIAGH